MIAKNVGIRRARGEFVLATNIDILFSDALMKRLARRDLRSDTLYRIDRYDVAAEVPKDVPVEEKLSYCENTVIRINRREGTYNSADGRLDRIYPPLFLVFLSALFAPLVPFFLVFDHILVLMGIAPDRLKHPLRPFNRLKRLIRLKRMHFVAKFLVTLPRVVLKIYARLVRLVWRRALFEFKRGRLHTNACGDFTLAARNRWFDLHGYAEFDSYSFHIDSLFCHAAICSGLKEEVFPEPARIYHIEHGSGSGFTPEHQEKLWQRIETLKIPRLDDKEFWDMVLNMRAGRRGYLFNGEEWGLANEFLPEWTPSLNPATVKEAKEI